MNTTTTLREYAEAAPKNTRTDDLTIAAYLHKAVTVPYFAVTLPWTPERPKLPRLTAAQVASLADRQVVVGADGSVVFA